MPVSIMIFPLCELATGCRQFSFLLLLTFLLSCDIGICNPSVIRNQEIHLRAFNPDSLSDGIKDKALNKLMQVFGIRPPSHRERHLFPPQYMLDLYNSIADSSGITKTANPYDANVIRSFPNRGKVNFYLYLRKIIVYLKKDIFNADHYV